MTHQDIVEENEVEQIVTLESLAADIKGVSERIRNYEKELKNIGRIVIMIGCDDARVHVPVEEFDGALYIYIPVIGGGVPEKETLDAVLTYIRELGISVGDVVEILVTQHGDTEEIGYALQRDSKLACGHITCGLRGVLETYRDELNPLRDSLLAFKETDDEGEFCDASNLLDEIFNLTGIPKRLIIRAVLRNHSSYIVDNLVGTIEAISKRSVALGLDKTKIYGGLYDHQEKEILVTERHTVLSQRIKLPISKWTKKYQDPPVIAVSFGRKAATVNNGLLLPKTIGEESRKSFDTTAITTRSQLLTALTEAWYAAKNASGGHGENFKSTNGCVIFCDNAGLVESAKKVLQSKSFINELKQEFIALGSMYLVNLEEEKVVEFNLVNGEITEYDPSS